MKIGIISDIHDNIPNLLKTIDFLNNQKVKKIYFCGDLVSAFTIKFIKGFRAPIKAVYGNNEGYKIGIAERINKYQADIKYGDKRGLVYEDKIDSLQLVVFHGHSYQLTQSLLSSPEYDLVFTGHTHEPHVKQIKNKVWVNPGSINGYSEKIDNKPSLAIFDTENKKGKIISI